MENDQKKCFQDIKLLLEAEGYNIQKTLGKGAFGEVFLVINKSNELLAVKSISKNHVKKRPFLQKYIKQEIEAMKTLKHPNLVRQDRVIETSQYYFMVLQYCDGGNLLTYQSKLKNKSFSVSEALQILVEVMKGLKVVHENNYIHRDIKSENVLIKNNEKGKAYKIADFGFARPIKSGSARTVCGTQKYMAPQILQNIPYTISVDLWALGILFYFMLFAEYPFKGFDILADIKKKCSTGFNVRENVTTKKDKLKECPSEIDDFFKKIFVLDSKKRITFTKIISHPLFRNFQHEFGENRNFYNQYEQQNLKSIQPEVATGEDDQFQENIADDHTRSNLIMRQYEITSKNRSIQRQIELTDFEISKVIYLRECSIDFYENYKNVLQTNDRLAIRYYVLRAFIFYSNHLLIAFEDKIMPKELEEYKLQKWKQFVDSKEYMILVNRLKIENMKGNQQFEDTYSQILPIESQIKIKHFSDKFTSFVTEKQFENFKVAYRSTTSYIFKQVHQNKSIDSHLKNKIKIRLFCCHMINRIFDQSEIENHFEYYIKWLKKNNIQYSGKFDFVYFKKWILGQSKQNLDKNILLLHKTFFSK